MLDAARAWTSLPVSNLRAFWRIGKPELQWRGILRSSVRQRGRASVAFREAHPVIPWKAIIGLRNALIHEYGEIRFEILWSVVQQKLPELIQELHAMNIDLTRAEED
ncbi:MAG TPA: DUF86 domain-containing protein [Candidatus Sumerlaeota bacterium]|nr:DUF86 domain-containing protein [Candidatus Sumerlaeota bacterium]